MNRPEILAPCGSYDSLIAAVRSGADAVYLGTKEFNARRNAGNFDFQQLKEAVSYCHGRNVKVHVTFNTLVSDDELKEAENVLKHICLCGADVLILQDVGLAHLVKNLAPGLERHASTQMSVQTSYGVNLLEKMGYCRAVLPRELSKNEIANIRSKTKIELETFVHGALCMCVSGQCLLSAMIGSRSGNRGFCAQPCRLPFKAKNGNGYDLSLKDLSLIDKSDELAELGIASLKIEGRMKRPEYVAAAVTSLKNKLDGKENPDINNALSAVFSRSGFTDGYYTNNRGSHMFGIRTKEDVVSADKSTFSKLSDLYRKETPRRKVNFSLSALKTGVSLVADCDGKTVEIQSDYVPQQAINKPATAEALTASLSKCGGTMFAVGDIQIILDEGMAIPASVVNSLRRECLENLDRQLSFTPPKQFNADAVPAVSGTKRHRAENPYIIRVSDMSQLPENKDGIHSLIFPLGEEEKALDFTRGTNIIPVSEIPSGIFGTDEALIKKLTAAKEKGITTAYCNTLDGIALANEVGMDIFGGFRLNVFNSLSAKVFGDMGVKMLTLSPELKMTMLNNITSDIPLSMIAYGRLPLMLTRNCPNRNGMSCKECKGKGTLTDRKGIEFPVECGNGCSELLNSRVIYLGDKQQEIKTDHLILYFTKENRDEVDAVLDMYRKGVKYNGEFTRGLYYRGVE